MKFLHAVLLVFIIIPHAGFAQPKLILPVGHVSDITASQYSADGKKVLTVSKDGTIKIWDDESGKLLLNFAENTGSATRGLLSGAFSPDNNKVITASNKGDASVWDAQTGVLLYVLHGNNEALSKAEFSADGKMIATACIDDTVRIWSVQLRCIIAVLYDELNNFRVGPSPTFYFCPDSTCHKIATVFSEHQVVLWDLDKIADPYVVKRIFHASNVINNDSEEDGDVRFTADGKKILIVAGATAIIRDVSPGKTPVALNRKGANAIRFAEFSPSGRQIITANSWPTDRMVSIWNVENGALIKAVKFKNEVEFVSFTPDSNKVIVELVDGTIRILNAKNLKPLKILPNAVYLVGEKPVFSPDGKKVLTKLTYNSLACWDVGSGIMLHTLSGHTAKVCNIASDKSSGNIAAFTGDGFIRIWDVVNGKPVLTFRAAEDNEEVNDNYNSVLELSPDGKRIIFNKNDWGRKNNFSLFNAASGEKITTISGANKFYFSGDSKRMFAHLSSKYTPENNYDRLLDAVTGNLIKTFTGINIKYFAFSPRSDKLITHSYKNTSVWDAGSGKLISTLKDTLYDETEAAYSNLLNQFVFSNDGSKVFAWGEDIDGIRMYDAYTGALLKSSGNERFGQGELDSAGEKILISGKDSTIRVFNLQTGNILFSVASRGGALNAHFSPDGKMISSYASDSNFEVHDAVTGKILTTIHTHLKDRPSYTAFSQDSKNIVMLDVGKTTAKVWGAANGMLLAETGIGYFGQNDYDNNPSDLIIIDPYHVRLLTTQHGEIKLYDLNAGKMQYGFLAVDSTSYLVYDSAGHYDGTRDARKLVYYTCNDEIIDLDQVKEQVWVPDLAARIIEGYKINAPGITDISICGVTPKLESYLTKAGYRFSIKPQSGGLGQTVLYVNDIEVKRYDAAQLKTDSGYQLVLTRSELQPYFITGKNNVVTAKSYTAQNKIASRDVKFAVHDTTNNTAKPNLYAVIVGVNDYKDVDMHLNYAAKDAEDIGSAISLSAKKLFNTAGKEHVFLYNLTSNNKYDRQPRKENIRKVFREIAKTATNNDILVIFFAGHGTMYDDGKKKQFYLLTSDASNALAVSAPATVGISMQELGEWMNPDSIKAQKRILIFDACQSGQAINDMVAIGSGGQNFVAARSDDKAEQARVIERLNERSGIFILAASASMQSALEMSSYSHGLLTYALLKAIKEQPGILDNSKYLNVSRWFDAAENIVDELAKENREKQSPQVFATGNFSVGMVDDEITGKIDLGNEKPFLGNSLFMNADLKFDNLNLHGLADQELNERYAPQAGGKIIYRPDYDNANTYSLTGDYTITGNNITVNLILVKGNTTKINSIIITGRTDQLPQLSKLIVEKGTAMLMKHS